MSRFLYGGSRQNGDSEAGSNYFTLGFHVALPLEKEAKDKKTDDEEEERRKDKGINFFLLQEKGEKGPQKRKRKENDRVGLFVPLAISPSPPVTLLFSFGKKWPPFASLSTIETFCGVW